MSASSRKVASVPRPEDRDGQGESQADKNVILSDPYGSAAESIHALRARIQSQHIQAGRRALAICGPTPEVGCTFVAVNLAASLAQVGVKTLLVDANLRAPSIQTYFNPIITGVGLYECLLSPSEPIPDFIHDSVQPNLDVMIAGETSRNAHEVLAGDEFLSLLNMFMRDYDMTIIDTPPSSSCADALRIASLAGYGLVVTRKNRTLVGDVQILLNDLRKERSTAIGTVLNSF